MTTPRILLLGKNGQVGWELQRSLAPLGEVWALDRHSTDGCGDLENLEGLRATVRRWRPHCIVNAAAHTAVDRAETETALAQRVNAQAPQVLAEEAQALGAWLCHYSTDYVFDGQGERPWQESDAPGPLNVYGQTKWAGEQAVQRHCERHLVLRTSWVYAARGGNFAKTMLRLATERDRLSVIDDQHGAPTGADLIADVTAQLLPRLWSGQGQAGLFHLAATGSTTWHGYASHLIEAARRLRPAHPWRVQAIDRVGTVAFPTPARRPLNSRLDTTRLRETFGLHLPPWQQGVERLLNEIV